MKERKLDGCYFRVERDGEWKSLCFTDLTYEERKKQLEGRSPEWLASMSLLLADVLREVADEFDIYGYMED